MQNHLFDHLRIACSVLSIAGATNAAPVTGPWLIAQGGGPLTNQNTASPIVGDGPAGSADTDAIHSSFPAITLANTGDRITLTGSATLTGIASGGVRQFRWGAYDFNGSGDTTGWLGYFATQGSGTTVGELYKRNSGNTSTFFSGTGVSTTGGTAPGTGTTFSDGTYSLSLAIEKVATGLQINSTITRTSDSQDFGSVSLLDTSPLTSTFNRVGFLIGGALDADQVQFSDIDVAFTPGSGNPDTDADGLPDSYEQTIIDANPSDLVDGLDDVMGTGASPAVTDFDDDGLSDAEEYALGSDPLDPLDPSSPPSIGPLVFGIDFNRNDSLGAPSQSMFRVIGGSNIQANNTSSYGKSVGPIQTTITQPGGTAFEFRGANGDGTRAIPGGDTSRSFLVADFIATRTGVLDIGITGLPAGNYIFRSHHLDTFTSANLGFAQGATATTPNTIEARIGGVVKDSVQATALGSSGLNTTFINDAQIPTLLFPFTHNGNSPLVIELRSTFSNGADNFLLLNGFEILQANP
jgi:hypothetical protein